MSLLSITAPLTTLPATIRRLQAHTAAAAPPAHVLRDGLHGKLATAVIDAHPETLTGHSDNVNCAELCVDGERVVSASDDKTARVWSVTTGRLLQIFFNHSDIVECIALFSDGATAVSSGSDNDKTVRIWRLHNAMEMRAFTGHTQAVWGVAVSPDDASIKLWNVCSGQCDATLTRHIDTVTCVAFSADGQTLASGSWDSLIKLWSVRCRSLLRTIDNAHTDIVYGVAFGGERLVSGSQDKTVKVWRWQSGDLITTLTGHTNWVWSVAVFPEGGDRVASGSRDKTVRIWNVRSGECQHTLTGHINAVRSVAVSRHGLTLLSGSGDTSVQVWTLR